MKNKKCTRSGIGVGAVTTPSSHRSRQGLRLPGVEATSDGCPARGAPDFPSPPLTWGAKRGYRKEVIL